MMKKPESAFCPVLFSSFWGKTTHKKLSVLAIVLALSFPIYAQKSSSSGSRPSYSSPRSSSSSRPSSPPRSSSSRPSSPSSSSKPPSSSKYSSPSSGKFTNPTKPSGSKPSSNNGLIPSLSGKSSASKPAIPSGKPTIKFDSAASSAQKREESKKAFIASNPKPSYTDYKGVKRTVDTSKPAVKDIRQMNYDTYSSRTERAKKTYGNVYNNYYTTTSRPYYNDFYSNMFLTWLMTRSVNDQAMWYYSHRNDMDQARWNDAMQKNAELRARVQALEQQKVQADPNYIPPGVDKDLMYDDDYVSAVYNPTPVETTSSTWTVLKVLFYSIVIVAVLSLVVYLVFYKNWGEN